MWFGVWADRQGIDPEEGMVWLQRDHTPVADSGKRTGAEQRPAHRMEVELLPLC